MDIVTSFVICLCLCVGLALHRVLVLLNMGALGVVLALRQSTDLQQTHSRQRKTAKTATRARWLEALVRERMPEHILGARLWPARLCLLPAVVATICPASTPRPPPSFDCTEQMWQTNSVQ